ncbi:hypothetical protein ACQPWY_31175 [Pseudonocardia xinjiangensis]|uniref:hypothetical protein n=1 Tax=Pseudonocardia xinjiangensis TaxID=75289 RepID=UPI003D9313AF
MLLPEPLLVSQPPAVTEHVAELVVLWVIVRVAAVAAVAVVAAVAGFAAAACSAVVEVVVAPVLLDAVPEHPVAPRSHCTSAFDCGRPVE